MSGRKIFLCYRREDSAGHAGRLYDRLNMRFPGRVFMDVAGIGLGTRWAEVIEQTLASCEVVLLLIGRRWLEPGPDGARRIDDPADPLRAEVTTALRLKMKVVPVLVGGASMPSREELPAEVGAVADWQAMRVDDDDFDHDATRLTRALEQQLTDEGVDPHLEGAAARKAQIEQLFKDTASAVSASAWVTAAQTLRAILSLDPGNQRALAELGEVERRSIQAYSAGQSASVVRAKPGRWAALGALGALAVVGGVGALVLLVVLLVWMETDGASSGDATIDDGMYAGAPAGVPPAADPALDEDADSGGEAGPARGEHAALVGRYVLAAYSQQGTRLPVVGRLTLTDDGQGRLRFETQASNQATGATFWYRGVMQQQGGMWTTTTAESNDPDAVAMAIPTDVQFDGATLVTTNAYGEAAVWQRQ